MTQEEILTVGWLMSEKTNNFQKMMNNGLYLSEDLINECVEVFDLKSKKRYRELAYARHYFCSALRYHKYTFHSIGKIMNKNHASVIHSVNMHNDLRTDTLYCEYTSDISVWLADRGINVN